MVEGENIVFGQEGKRVETINTDVIELLKVKTPEVIQEENCLYLSCSTQGADIFYTTDGTQPTIYSDRYTGMILISEDTELRFFAMKNGMVNSDEVLYSAQYQHLFYLQAEEDNVEIGFNKGENTPNIEMSRDSIIWERMDTFGPVTLEHTGDRVYFRGTNDYLGTERKAASRAFHFNINGKTAAFGDITRMLSKKGKHLFDNTNTNAFAYLFHNCSGLTTAPELPTTKLAESCYYGMFQGCTSLNTSPELPATKLAESCYRGMFNGCTSLTTAPELPATKLAESCYHGMFNGCTSLTTAPELPATKLSESCYSGMFNGCTSLTTAPELPATELAQSCYYGMFENCTSLTTAPELPATELSKYCYYGMFKGCTSLTTAHELPATELAEGCYSYMFGGCSSLTTAPELPATELAQSCYSQIFYNCTSLTTAPELPAAKLEDYCYQNMFESCILISYIKCLAEDISAVYSTSKWLKGVSPTGTFVKSPQMTSWTSGVDGIPENWTVEDNQ